LGRFQELGDGLAFKLRGFGLQLRKGVKKAGKADPKVKARERKLLIQEVIEGGETFAAVANVDKDVATLQGKLNILTTSKPGKLIEMEMLKQPVSALLKAQTSYHASTNMSDKYEAVCESMFSEYANIKKKVADLQEVTATTKTTVKLIYGMEFQGAKGPSKKTYVKRIAKVLARLAGGEVSASEDDENQPLFEKKDLLD
jgi:hypothetical protein